MSESHVVSGLSSKRAQIAGQLVVLKKQVTQMQEDLVHLDASIRLFAPDVDPSQIKPRRTNKINRYFVKGEAQKLTLTALREAAKPMNSRELTDILLASKGLAPTNALIARIQKNVIAVLRRHKGTLLQRVTDKDEPGGMKWGILV